MVFCHHVLAHCYKTAHLPFTGYFKDFSKPPEDFTFFLFYPFSFFHAGVAIFFVVSGFCIHLSYLQNPSWVAFFSKRFFRVYPPYIFALGLFSIILSNRDIVQLASHSLLIHNFWQKTFFGINASFWSIAIEAQLYLIYPVLLLTRGKTGWRTSLVVVAICELGIRLIWGFLDVPFFIKYSPFAFWFSWSLGAYLAHRYQRKRPLVFNKKVIAVVVILAVVVHHIDFLKLFFPLVSLATFMTLSNQIFTKREITKSILTNHLAFVGLISYSFYLLHQPLLKIWIDAFKPIISHPALLILTSIPLWFLLCIIAYCSYELIEKPSINFGKWVLMVSNWQQQAEINKDRRTRF